MLIAWVWSLILRCGYGRWRQRRPAHRTGFHLFEPAINRLTETPHFCIPKMMERSDFACRFASFQFEWPSVRSAEDALPASA